MKSHKEVVSGFVGINSINAVGSYSINESVVILYNRKDFTQLTSIDSNEPNIAKSFIFNAIQFVKFDENN